MERRFFNMRKQKGFSLIELLIVVAIILIIAAIAIPSLLRSKIAANEASAVASTRTIVTAQVTYANTYSSTGFAANLLALGPPAGAAQPDSTAAGLIDGVLAAGQKSGYAFLTASSGGAANVPASQFTASATPNSTSTGSRVFCTNESGVLHGVQGTTTAACDPTVANTAL
jgi:prepilin-type N-terminal cleavage/methylation domain-containing protein